MRTVLLLLTLPLGGFAASPWDPYIGPLLKRFRQEDPLLLSRFHPSVSFGKSRDGLLLFGLQVPPGPGVHVLHPRDAWAVPEAIYLLHEAAQKVRERFPGGMDLVVLDASKEHGGRFPPHGTHQQGRDIDTRYYLKGVKPGDHSLHFVGLHNLDCQRIWALIEALRPNSEVLYMDYRIQKHLYKYALKELKMSKQDLKPLLSYPHGKRRKGALVHHFRGHWNHLHVRFRTPFAEWMASFWGEQEIKVMQRKLDLRLYGRYQYVIKKGDTLGAIASKHGVGVDDLRRWNRLKKRSILQLGQTLDIRKRLSDSEGKQLKPLKGAKAP